MEKWMIVYVLPLEVWMDILCFPWISRRKFGRIVGKIGNFKFAEHAQFYLHEWGKRTLGTVYFKKNGLYKYVADGGGLFLDVPQTPMPENIKYINYIFISYFDTKAIDFLGKIRPLLTDVDIQFFVEPDNLEDLRTILTNLAPMLDGGIHTLQCQGLTLPMAKQCFREKFANLKVLDFNCEYAHMKAMDEAMQQEITNSIVDWLITPPRPNNNDAPKLCEICFSSYYGFFEQISTAVRQQFLAAKTPCTFAIIVYIYMQVTEFHLDNGIGEELLGEWNDNTDEKSFQITRHQANCGKKELQEWSMAKSREMSNGRIWLCYPTIGSLDAAQLDVPPVDVVEEQAEQQKPCSSKNA